MASSSSSPAATPPEDLEWEEWDPNSSPLSFFHHCLAGSFAGVAEHTLLYPLDTVKTCWQSQVLHKASGGAVGCSGEPCGIVAETIGKVRGAGASVMGGGGSSVLSNHPLSQAIAAGSEAKKATAMPSNSLKLNQSLQQQQQGIWSTMKHLMQQGQGSHSHGHSVNHQISHAHVYTLAGNPPNVVDMTGGDAASSSISSSSESTGSKTKRPWSKQSRVLRNATIQDITAHGMIRVSGGSVGSSGAAMTSAGAGSISNQTITHNNNHGAAGFKRLWRGVQTMFVGCIPAHALYFSSYEIIKSICTDHGHPHPNQHHNDGAQEGGHVGHDTLSPTQAMLAGGVATLLHDLVMTPMDTMKQRMQLGHYDNLRHAFASIVWGDAKASGSGDGMLKAAATNTGEGWKGLYRSFPVTLMTNVPYGMIMMSTNEWLRGVLEDGLYGIHDPNEYEENPFHFATILLSGMGAGTIASAATAPLDRIKTRLQTQRMGMVVPGGGSGTSIAQGATSSAGASAASAGDAATTSAIMEERALAAAQGKPKVCPKMAVRDVKNTLFPTSSATSPIQPLHHQTQHTIARTPFKTYYTTPREAFQSILQEEGPRGLFRGTLPRVALHAPSVAISWTAYEMAKDWLVWFQHH